MHDVAINGLEFSPLAHSTLNDRVNVSFHSLDVSPSSLRDWSFFHSRNMVRVTGSLTLIGPRQWRSKTLSCGINFGPVPLPVTGQGERACLIVALRREVCVPVPPSPQIWLRRFRYSGLTQARHPRQSKKRSLRKTLQAMAWPAVDGHQVRFHCQSTLDGFLNELGPLPLQR
eukprot:3309935-Amphidinium_carterae.3